MSGYLAEAANHSWNAEKEQWLKEKQTLLKESKYKQVCNYPDTPPSSGYLDENILDSNCF